MNETDPLEVPPPPPASLTDKLRSRRDVVLPWGLFGICVLALVFTGLSASSANSRVDTLRAKLAEQEKAMAKQKNELGTLAKAHDNALAESESLAKDSQKLASELEATKAANDAAKKALAQAKKELLDELAAEIKRGEIFVKEKGTGLVVDVSDKVLFDTGDNEINERGKEVLKQVAVSLRRMHGHVFQVGGHTDNERIVSPEIRERFPTNWELSTSRATNVVRYLSEKCGVPGNRLVAAGYARFRPVAPNTTDANKARNRRIEIAILRESR